MTTARAIRIHREANSYMADRALCIGVLVEHAARNHRTFTWSTCNAE